MTVRSGFEGDSHEPAGNWQTCRAALASSKLTGKEDLLWCYGKGLLSRLYKNASREIPWTYMQEQKAQREPYKQLSLASCGMET
jgi:hypothetical protein